MQKDLNLKPQCPHCQTVFESLSEMSKRQMSTTWSNPWFKQHVKICRLRLPIEREYWKIVKDWPRKAATERLLRDGLAAVLARRKDHVALS